MLRTASATAITISGRATRMTTNRVVDAPGPNQVIPSTTSTIGGTAIKVASAG